MDIETQERATALYWDIRKRAEEDPEYVRLREITEELERKYEAAVVGLTQGQRQAVELYITARENMNLRLLEFACEGFVQLK